MGGNSVGEEDDEALGFFGLSTGREGNSFSLNLTLALILTDHEAGSQSRYDFDPNS